MKGFTMNRTLGALVICFGVGLACGQFLSQKRQEEPVQPSMILTSPTQSDYLDTLARQHSQRGWYEQPRSQLCLDCGGSGNSWFICASCGGTGRSFDGRKIACDACAGRGFSKCLRCGGTGRR
jgi:hypothetical protein